ncbi:MscS family membrane protein [Paenibacillus sp. UNCCL117]|uniref:mechanosensitive ion channel family protein n=1 Tax=unclassified Paenibacillus TaxID=185978 RepID=UPI00088E0C45|nr:MULTISPECIES: mechanosensitive ion channel family protein [unclassified Paenibacillus]SDD49782.1 MscS family membrane protein [Paenibacillus sp. cl123]SFW49879.1 MscS family membrane protein [Paenibacillus sp. UNCCL117]
MDIMDWAVQLAYRVHWVDVSIAAGIMLLFLLFRKLFTRYAASFLVKRLRGSDGSREWIGALEKPIRLLFVVAGVYLATAYLVPAHTEFRLVLDKLFRSAAIGLVGWGIFNISAASSLLLLEGVSKRLGLDESSMLLPFLSRVLRFVIVLFSVTLIATEWGFSINGVVAGMGLGSLAVALAAKDTLGNIFGGIVIIMEKPFAKNDWILTPSVEGFVEDITFRSTQIRTFADSVVTVPNATLAAQPITNWSRMGKRRISFTLGVALDSDRNRLASAIDRMEALLTGNEEIDPKTIMVKFTEFNESSLGIFFYFFTKTTVWAEYLTVRQEMNLAIMRILEEEGIRLAYPAQRVFLEEAAQAGQRLRA